MFKKQLIALFIISLTSLSAIANQAANIEVVKPFAREVPPMAMASASFMTLKNTSNQDILLIKADSEIAKKVELHTHINDGGVMRMREVPNIKIPANGKTSLKPGGLHIMLISLNKVIKAGDTVKVELTFEDGSQKTVAMPVKSLLDMGMNHMKN